MKAILPALLAGLITMASLAVAGPVREIEITPDPPDGGQQIFNIRFTPGETRVYDRIVFDCVYHQEYVSQATDSAGSKLVNEQYSFTYRAKDIKLVDDLDKNIAFRVPIGLARMKEMFGLTAFTTNAPITIAQIRITAFTAEGQAWTYKLPASGLHKIDAEAATPAAKP